MTMRANDDRFWGLVDANAEVEVIGSGFNFTEGPIWHPRDHYLLFSDMPGDVRRRWQDGEVTEVRRPADKCNGMTYDADLNLIVCEHSTSKVMRERPDGGRETVASHYEGVELNSPNDVVVRADGTIYFSDPWYGRMPGFGLERPRELGWQGVFRVAPGADGATQLCADRDTFDQPNGLCFSPDESLLYINDTTHALVRVYSVNADGSLEGGDVFADGLSDEDVAGVPDGMKCDEQGNIWVTGPGGVWVFDPDANHLGVVEIDEVVANLHWGGPDFHTLFFASSSSVRSLRTIVGPHTEAFMRA